MDQSKVNNYTKVYYSRLAIRSSDLGREQEFYFLQNIQTSPGAHTACNN